MKKRIGWILIALGMAFALASEAVPQHGMPPIRMKNVPPPPTRLMPNN
jgi:hypothetical protein